MMQHTLWVNEFNYRRGDKQKVWGSWRSCKAQHFHARDPSFTPMLCLMLLGGFSLLSHSHNKTNTKTAVLLLYVPDDTDRSLAMKSLNPAVC